MAFSNYADRPSDSGALPEHRDRLSSNPRAFTPSETENDAGGYSTLAVDSAGDWSWKPQRDRALGYGKDSQFRTFRGVPAGAPELYRSAAFSRS